MRIEVVADERALASRAADLICETVRSHPRAALGLPTGKTPLATYVALHERAESLDFSGIVGYAIDEFADATRTTAGTNTVYYRRHMHLPLRALHVPNPGAERPEEHIVAFAAALHRAGELELCALGIGANGHIAFNEPGSAFDSRARVVTLDETSREAHAPEFGSLDKVPRHGMTLGVADILEARAILVLAQGASKAAIVRRAIEDEPSSDVPASWLRRHASVIWLIDRAAAADLSDVR
jgi:glucosamine-6-phosphate deaminase